MPVSIDLVAKPMHPLGSVVTNLDVSSPDHLCRIPSLLYSSGVLVFPANSQAPNAPNLNTVESLSKIAASLATIETEHPVNPLVQNSPVQQMITTRKKGDAYIFHSDMTWNRSPSLACVLCMVQNPKTGGNTCFRSSTQMYDALSPGMKEKLSRTLFVNSLTQSYSTIEQVERVKKERFAVHPGVIRHPVTGKPCFYVNENTTTMSVGDGSEEGEDLLRMAFDQIKDVGIYRHKWTTGDIVIWDNMGVQHMAMNDYTEKRVVFRVSAGEKWFRPDRFVGDRLLIDAVKDIRERMDKAGWLSYDKEVARVFEHDMRECGYKLPEIVVREVMEHVAREDRAMEEIKVLDVGAGTGLVGIELKKVNGRRFKADAVDRSEEMASEAKRRMIYEEYHVKDVNEGLGLFEKGCVYDAVVCVDGLNRNEIVVEKSLAELVKVSKTDGLIVLAMGLGEKNPVRREVERLTRQGVVRVRGDYNVIGFQGVPEIEFNVTILQAK